MAVEHALQDVPEIGKRLDGIKLGGLDERAGDGLAVSTAVGTGEQMVLAAQGDRPDGAFDRPSTGE